MSNNHPKRRFTLKLWNRWLATLADGPDEQDPQYRYLSDGIAAFRRQLAAKEAKKIV